jgi:hypothetical protein
MSYTMLPDMFDERMERADLDANAFTLYVCALIYSARNSTDGQIPRRKAGRLYDVAEPDKAVKDLIAADLWEDAENGYQIVHWNDYVEPAEIVEARQAAKRQYDREFQRDRLRAKGVKVVEWRQQQAKAAGMSVRQWLESQRDQTSDSSDSYEPRIRVVNEIVHESSVTTRHDTTRHDRKGSGVESSSDASISPRGSIGGPKHEKGEPSPDVIFGIDVEVEDADFDPTIDFKYVQTTYVEPDEADAPRAAEFMSLVKSIIDRRYGDKPYSGPTVVDDAQVSMTVTADQADKWRDRLISALDEARRSYPTHPEW